MHLNSEDDESFDGAWKAEEFAYQNLLKLKEKSPQEVYGALWQKAFLRQPKTVVCIDERVSLNNPDEPEIGIAGTLALMNECDFAETITKLKRAGVDRITYHEGCGAVALHKQQSGDPRDALEIAKNTAEKVSQALQLTSSVELCGYDKKADLAMTGNPSLHNARAIVVDGTGRFNPPLLGFPAHFLLSAFYEPSLKYTAKELEVAIQIALGDHGFGKKRFAKAPLIIVLVGGANEYNLSDLISFFNPIFKQYEQFLSVIALQGAEVEVGLLNLSIKSNYLA